MFKLFKSNKDKEKTGGDKEKVNAHYYNMQVREIIQETSDAFTIVFEEPEGEMDYKAGQFLTLITQVDGKEVRRCYSLCTSRFTDKYPAVMVKRVAGGVLSNHLAEKLKAGDLMKVMEPMGKFTTDLREDKKRHLILFAGGSGITPMMAITKEILHGEPNSIISLIYANRNIDAIIYKERLDDIQRNYEGRFRVIHILDDAPMDWQGPSGLLNREILEKLFERIPDWGVGRTQYLMCGPEGMMNNVEGLLDDLSIPRDKIFKESFVAGTLHKKEVVVEAEEDSGENKAREVKVIYEGEEYVYTVQPDKTILETALEMDIDLPYSCQSGLCTACRGRCLSGKVKMDEEEGLSEAELKEGYVLTCVGHPLSDDVVIEIG